MEGFLSVETLTIELLFVAALVAIAARRLRLPYTVALVLVGLLITFRQPLEIELTPEIILALFVPPLVFEAAFHVEFRRLREALLPILVLAIPGVLLTTSWSNGSSAFVKRSTCCYWSSRHCAARRRTMRGAKGSAQSVRCSPIF